MSYECDNDNHDIGCQCPGYTRPDTIEANELRAWVDKTLTTTQELIDDPIPVSTVPPPDYWEGYKRCLEDMGRCINVWITKPT